MFSLLPLFIYLLTGFTLGVIVQTAITWSHMRRKQPAPVQQGDPGHAELQLLANEWRTTIQMQMKFNDLIIRFRAIVLSVLMLSLLLLVRAYFTGAIVGVDMHIMLAMLFVFWLACFILDYGYYHQLLLGAVRHARKFDDNAFFRSKGLFGLTEQINLEIGLLRSKVVMWLFYLLPMCIISSLFYLMEMRVI
jgi:hypothetical protein